MVRFCVLFSPVYTSLRQNVPASETDWGLFENIGSVLVRKIENKFRR